MCVVSQGGLYEREARPCLTLWRSRCPDRDNSTLALSVKCGEVFRITTGNGYFADSFVEGRDSTRIVGKRRSDSRKLMSSRRQCCEGIVSFDLEGSGPQGVI